MTKTAFLLSLHDKLAGLPRHDIEERLSFYTEMIEDHMEEGLSEEEAVAAIGSVEDVAAQIVATIPLIKLAKETIKPNKRLKVWEIVLLAVGSPIWVSLLIAAFAVAFSLYVSLWAIVVSLWAVFVSLAACALSDIAVGVGFAITDNAPAGIALIGAGLVCAGLSVFFFFGCTAAVRGMVWLTKKTGLGLKRCLIRKEAAHE